MQSLTISVPNMIQGRPLFCLVIFLTDPTISTMVNVVNQYVKAPFSNHLKQIQGNVFFKRKKISFSPGLGME